MQPGVSPLDTRPQALDGINGRACKIRLRATVPAGEALDLDIFIDNSVIEVYANERQAICRRVYPETGGEQVLLYGTPGARVEELVAYEVMPSNFR